VWVGVGGNGVLVAVGNGGLVGGGAHGVLVGVLVLLPGGDVFVGVRVGHTMLVEVWVAVGVFDGVGVLSAPQSSSQMFSQR
jgi:hypothetical protein